MLALSACSSSVAPPATETPAPQAAAAPLYSSADSLLLLLNTPETFDVLRRHIPYFVNLTEHGVIPAFSTQMTLGDLLNVPEARLTPDLLVTINRELAAIGPAA